METFFPTLEIPVVREKIPLFTKDTTSVWKQEIERHFVLEKPAEHIQHMNPVTAKLTLLAWQIFKAICISMATLQSGCSHGYHFPWFIFF